MRLDPRPSLAALALVLGACRPGQGEGPRTPAGPAALGPVMAVPVAPGAFAARTAELLRDGAPSTERRNRLAGVVEAQLARAEARFLAGATEAGVSAVEGAFLLVRAPEDDPALYAAHPAALGAAADACARTGSEGRALALYERLAALLPPGPARSDVQGHLDALARWREAARAPGSVTAAAFDRRLWSNRAVLDPSAATLRAAHGATAAWVSAALTLDPSTLDLEDPQQRAAALEAYAAAQTGGAAVVASYLRHGDAAGALAAISAAPFAEVSAPGLIERVQAASAGEPAAWAELFALYAAVAEGRDRDFRLDPEVARAAAWGAAVELYRVAPDSPAGTLPLAGLLPRHGMTEVLPLVLADGLGEGAPARDLGSALALLIGAIADEGQAGRMDIARETFRVAAPILARAEQARTARELRPSPARLHYVMAALEARSAEVERARRHVVDALRVAPDDLDALGLLATIERQRGDERAALQALERASGIAERSRSEAALATTLLARFEIHRDAGAADRHADTLRAALIAALGARSAARMGHELARAERLCARALELYGAAEAAGRATLRALDASRADRDELAATLIDGMRRALTLEQLPLGRVLAREAIAADLDPEDLVYVALWLSLLERRAGAEPDGTVAEALGKVSTRTGWIGALRAWGSAELDDAGLLGAARSPAERTEARFYTAMAGRAGGDLAAGLAAVAESPAIELVEVTLARDLLAAGRPGPRPSLPPDVTLP